jgi:hypothetical protein
MEITDPVLSGNSSYHNPYNYISFSITYIYCPIRSKLEVLLYIVLLYFLYDKVWINNVTKKSKNILLATFEMILFRLEDHPFLDEYIYTIIILLSYDIIYITIAYDDIVAEKLNIRVYYLSSPVAFLF